MMKIRATARIFSYSGRHAKISLKFTDKAFIFDDLPVIKTHFTDKPSIFIDVSVNGSDFAKCSAELQLLNRCT
ncbi:MAG: prevent-host-death protein [Ligilactobacillus ruminis]